MLSEQCELYSASKKEVGVVDVPEINYLMVDGKGDSNTEKNFQGCGSNVDSDAAAKIIKVIRKLSR